MEGYLNKIDKITDLLKGGYFQLAEEKLQELKNVVIYDIAVKNCGRKNSKEQLTNAKAFLKHSKEANEFRPLLHKIYKYDDTYQLCDGFCRYCIT